MRLVCLVGGRRNDLVRSVVAFETGGGDGRELGF